MTEKAKELFTDKLDSKPTRKNYRKNKTDVYLIDDIWSSNILDLKDSGSEKIRGYRYVFVVIDKFSKFGWTVPLKKNFQSIKDFSENILISLKRKPDLFESDRGKEFCNNISQLVLKIKDIKLYSRNT